MLVSEIMTRDVCVASPEDTLQHAAEAMERDDFGILPVREGDRLVGMLTDRDITVRAVARGLAPAQCKVRAVMSTDVRFVHQDAPVEEAARLMSESQIRRLPVLDRTNRLVGIVALADVAINDPEPAGAALTSISQPATA
jgi:CBS domain-containing protein